MNALCFSALHGRSPCCIKFLSLCIVYEFYYVTQNFFPAHHTTCKDVLNTIRAVACVFVVECECCFQHCHALVIQHVGKHQHRHIVEVRHRLQLVGVGKQSALPCIHAHDVAMLIVAVVACVIHQLHSIGQLVLQRPTVAQCYVVADFAQCSDNTLAHTRYFGKHTHHIGVAIKRLADEHILQELPANGTQTLVASTAVHHFGHLRLWYHSCTVQVIHRAEARLWVVIEVAQSIIAVDGAHDATETVVAHGFTQFHGLLRLVLRLHFLLVELRKGLCRVRHGIIGDERHTRMLHTLHLLGSETELVGILFQIIHVCAIGIVPCSNLTCYGSSVAGKDYAVVAHHWHVLQGSLVILLRNTLGVSLCVTVALIVAVIYAVVVSVHRETVCLCPILGVVAGR